jgi:hypothetical protein
LSGRIASTAAFMLMGVLAGCVHGTGHVDHEMHGSAIDTREPVRFPETLREHTLANMRDHLQTLQRMQASLAVGHYDDAAHVAENRLGLTSLPLHGAHDVAPYMPQPMQDMGTAMHKAASRFALEATSASASGDMRPALVALSDLTAHCVACHAAYRLAP